MSEPELAEVISNLTSGIEAELTKDAERARLRAVPPPQQASKAVLSVTNEDTGRATRTMLERMITIVGNLERELSDADTIRINVLHRIEDLKLALETARSAVEILKVRGNLK